MMYAVLKEITALPRGQEFHTIMLPNSRPTEGRLAIKSMVAAS